MPRDNSSRSQGIVSRSGERPSARAAQSRSTQIEALRGMGKGVSLGKAARILRSADEVKAKVNAHHQKHASAWTQKRYQQLLKKDAPKATLSLRGMSDPKERLMAQAQNGVAGKLTSRTASVDRARSRMLQSGQVREGRRPQWGRGLGE